MKSIYENLSMSLSPEYGCVFESIYGIGVALSGFETGNEDVSLSSQRDVRGSEWVCQCVFKSIYGLGVALSGRTSKQGKVNVSLNSYIEWEWD